MSIGLYDDDMMRYGEVPFNLELMKISSYYKSKRELVVLSKELNPQRYENFFFRKDYYDGNYPTEIAKEKNVILGGYAFHPEIYTPLDIEIERCPADNTIYQKYRELFARKKNSDTYFSSMYNAAHFRLSLNGKSLFDGFEKQVVDRKKAFFLHDLNPAAVEGAPSFLSELAESNPKMRLGTKFPIKIYNNPAALKVWTSFATMKNYYPLYYYGLLSDEDFIRLFNLQSKNTTDQFKYFPFYQMNEREIIETLEKIYVQMLYARGQARPVRIEFEETSTASAEIKDLVRLFNEYIFARMGYNKGKPYPYFTFYNYITKKKKSLKVRKLFLKDDLPVERMRDLFAFTQLNNYDVFKLFYESAYAKFEQGRLIPCVG